MRQPILLGCIAILAAGSSHAQTILVRSDSGPVAGSVSVRTPRGEVSASVTPVEPPRNLTALLFVQTLVSDDLEAIRGGLQKMYTAFPDLKLAIISSAGVQFAGPFARARDFKATLAEINLEESVPDPAAAQSFYQRLPAALRDFGSDWSSVMLVARFPKLDPPLNDFAPTFLAAKISTQKVRTLYWNLSPESPAVLDLLASIAGGAVVTTDIDSVLTSLTSSTQSFAEVSWTDPKLRAVSN